ncbi:NAD(P)-dependent oxidoreductase [Granulicella aggregans]|uniref:NAD(P)-dependent oxidoreductase n=1 Tax=Granulicella aggregans TaxID=474949 RepID=UPI0021DFBEDD|nr:NAD(P)-dependent oxidoreductase [Granulicella aggregans]
MNIGFLHSGESEFNNLLLGRLNGCLRGHTVLSWLADEKAPSKDFDVLLVNGDLGSNQMEGQPNLKLIQTTNTGYESIDIASATELGIWVSYAPSGLTGNATSVAEFAILLILASSRHLSQIVTSVHGGQAYAPYLSSALNGKTVCIVGLGSIGRQIVERLRPFGVLILATDEHPEDAPSDVTAFPAEKLEVAVADADYVVLCVRASKENEGLVSASVLRSMKHGAVLINVARGSLVDEGALLSALKDGHISAIGLDVVRNEPLDQANPLLRVPQALVTPHIAAYTDLMLSGTVDYIFQVIRDFEAERKPASVLNNPARPRLALREDQSLFSLQ